MMSTVMIYESFEVIMRIESEKDTRRGGYNYVHFKAELTEQDEHDCNDRKLISAVDTFASLVFCS